MKNLSRSEEVKMYARVYWNTFVAVAIALTVYTAVSFVIGHHLTLLSNSQTVVTSPLAQK